MSVLARERTWPFFEEEEIARVAAVLRSGRVNGWTGPEVGEFERLYAEHLGRAHAIAVANGTLALELALHALDLPANAEVVVTPRSFIASASAVTVAGATPVFADVDPHSQNITAETIERALTPRSRAVIVVHLAGWPCDMEAITALARRRDLRVIEDCAQAHGATIEGRPVGSFGDVACFSFCQDKIISTGGEGGLVALDDAAAWKRAWSRKEHGKNPDTVFGEAPRDGGTFRWLHDSIGTNMRLTGPQAAMGTFQLARLEEHVAIRSRNASIMAQALRGARALRTPEPPQHMRHAWYRLYAFARPERLRPGWSRDRIVHETVARGVPCFSGSCSEIYREGAFRDHGVETLPVAHALGETSLAYLVDPSFEAADMRTAGRIAREVVDDATL